MSHYDTLSVSQTAPVEVIRGAYKALSQIHHPDKGGDPEKMTAINEAWHWLSDPDRRAAHDMWLSFQPPFFTVSEDGTRTEYTPKSPAPPTPKEAPPVVRRPDGAPFEVNEELLRQMRPVRAVHLPRKRGQVGGLTAVIMRAFGVGT